LALFLEKLLVILLGLVLNTSIAHWSCLVIQHMVLICSWKVQWWAIRNFAGI